MKTTSIPGVVSMKIPETAVLLETFRRKSKVINISQSVARSALFESPDTSIILTEFTPVRAGFSHGLPRKNLSGLPTLDSFQASCHSCHPVIISSDVEHSGTTNTRRHAKGSVKEPNISINFFFFRPSLNRVLFPMFCLPVEGEC